MSAVASSASVVAPTTVTDLEGGITVQEYHALCDRGAFDDARTELIDGRVIFEMGQYRLHYMAIRKVLRALQPLEANGLYANTQGSVQTSARSAPEPDVFVTRLDPDTLTREIVASDLVLAIEVAVTSLAKDRFVKTSVYARADIPEYWIMNPLDRQVEVYRAPADGVYGERTVFEMDGEIAPLMAPDYRISVAKLMPPLDTDPS